MVSTGEYDFFTTKNYFHYRYCYYRCRLIYGFLKLFPPLPAVGNSNTIVIIIIIIVYSDISAD